MRVRILLAVMGLALLGFAPAPFHRKERPREGPAEVNGTWEVVACEFRGAADERIRKNYVIEMTKQQAVFVEKGGTRTLYPMRLDPEASPPSFTWNTGDRVGYVGSYRLRKGEMVLIFEAGGRVADRPVDFAGNPTWKYVLRRVKRN